jgi:LCP family protein required for cell wall assembly
VLAIDTTPLRRPRRARGLLVVALCTTVAGAAGTFAAAHRAVGDVPRVKAVAAVLSQNSAVVDNYLLVGSDSRAAGDPNTGGTAGDVTGNRSDTIMVLRIDRNSGHAALLSIPRDLYVTTSGRTGRINGAYNDGAAALVTAVQEALQLPVHHYVEIDFSGFRTLVDALGGVVVCFDLPARDKNTGLDIPVAGCHLLNGTSALAYARSRHYEELLDGTWNEDPTSDLGRSRRQRDFVNRTLRTALDRVKSDPFQAGSLVHSIGAAIAIDGTLDPIDAASTLRTAVDAGLVTYSLPVVPKKIGGADVLVLGDGADAVLNYFRGTGPEPAPGS